MRGASAALRAGEIFETVCSGWLVAGVILLRRWQRAWPSGLGIWVILGGFGRAGCGGSTGGGVQGAAGAGRFVAGSALGVSGIDGAGKSYGAERAADALRGCGVGATVIGVDPWLNPPGVRESGVERGPHFYRHAVDFEGLFARVVEPLCAGRAIDEKVMLGGQSGRVVEHVYKEAGVDVVLVEGVFLFARPRVARFDVKVWVDCSYAAAFERAAARSQEGLSGAELERDYRTMYFAAQAHRYEMDDPRRAADLVLCSNELVTSGAR